MTFWGGGRLVKYSYACGMASASSLCNGNLMIIVQKMIPIGVFFCVRITFLKQGKKGKEVNNNCFGDNFLSLDQKNLHLSILYFDLGSLLVSRFDGVLRGTFLSF